MNFTVAFLTGKKMQEIFGKSFEVLHLSETLSVSFYFLHIHQLIAMWNFNTFVS
jgi:hypothetical protein